MGGGSRRVKLYLPLELEEAREKGTMGKKESKGNCIFHPLFFFTSILWESGKREGGSAPPTP